jgi:hypothetical protein
VMTVSILCDVFIKNLFVLFFEIHNYMQGVFDLRREIHCGRDVYNTDG